MGAFVAIQLLERPLSRLVCKKGLDSTFVLLCGGWTGWGYNAAPTWNGTPEAPVAAALKFGMIPG